MSAEPKIIQGGIAVDDRGQIAFVNEFDFRDVKRFYVIQNRTGFYQGMAWTQKEGKYFFVAKGCGAYFAAA